MTTDTRSLLDQIAEARRERDAAAVRLADYGIGYSMSLLSDKWADVKKAYRTARTRLAALEAKLKEQEEAR